MMYTYWSLGRTNVVYSNVRLCVSKRQYPGANRRLYIRPKEYDVDRTTGMKSYARGPRRARCHPTPAYCFVIYPETKPATRPDPLT